MKQLRCAEAVRTWDYTATATSNSNSNSNSKYMHNNFN